MSSVPQGAANKHQQRTEVTRRKLLKSARRVFARDGFEAARIEDIAKDAGHSRGAFYANFESKEDLFFQLLEQQAGEHIGNLQRLLDCCNTQEERLAALRDYYVARMGDRQWSMLMLEFKLFALRHSEVRPQLLRKHRRIRACVHAAKMQQLMPLEATLMPQESVRRALEATLNGLVLEHAYDPGAISEEEVNSILRRIFDLLIQPSFGKIAY